VKKCFFIPLALLLLVSCRSPAQKGAVVVEDMVGRSVGLPAAIHRIVGVRPGALRLLAYMDVADKVVGIEQVESAGDRPYTLACPELLKQPFIGPRGGDAELLLSVRPDLIFATYLTAGEADALQEKTGIPVLVLDYPEMGTDIDRLYASLELIGRVMHREARADTLTAYIRQTLDELNRRTAAIPASAKPGAYIGGIAHGRARGITSTHPDYPPFRFVHARNVADALDRRLTSSLAGAYVDVEQLMRWNPDVVFVDEAGLELVGDDLLPGTLLGDNLSARQTRRIYTLLPYNSYAANYEIALIDSWFIGQTLYPEAFAGVDLEEKANEILCAFLGQTLFDRLLTPHSFKPVYE
jgi:iron complex transport system substrate-binding protein